MKALLISISMMLFAAFWTATLAQNWQFDFLDIATLPEEITQRDVLITSAAQDKDGFIWLVVDGGILKYDGVTFYPFAKGLDEQIVPITFYYHQMRIGPDGDIWLVSLLNGSLHIESDGSLCTLLVPEKDPERKESVFTDIFFENDSIAWLSSSDFRFHRHNILDHTWKAFSAPLPENIKDDLSFGTILQDTDNPDQFWISSKHGIFLFEEDSENFTFYQLDTAYQFYTREHLSPMHIFKDKIFLGGPANIGVDVFNRKTKKWDTHLYPPPMTLPGMPQVLSFYTYSDSLVLVGTYDNARMGLIRQNRKGELSYEIKKYNIDPGALAYTQMFIRSDDGNVRAIGNKGITKIKERKTDFTFYRLTERGGVRNNWQRSFLQLEDPTKFLLGTFRGDGLIEVDWKERKHRMIPFRSSEGFLNYDVTMWSLAKDQENRIWIGSEEGLLCADLEQSRIWQPEEASRHPVLEKADINFLHYHDTNLWIHTRTNGSYLLNTVTALISDLPEWNGLKVNCLSKQNDRWWIGTKNGLKVFDLKSHELTEVSGAPVEMEVTDLVQMGDSLWIATAKHGLWNLHNKGKAKWVQYLNPEVYRSNFLHKLVAHKEKNQLWLNTAYGFAAFDLSSHRYVNYTLDDGISFTRRNGSIFTKLYDGAIISGANRFFQYFYPDFLSKDVPAPQPYLKEVSTNGIKISENQDGKFVLDAGSEHISFSMGALNLNSAPVNYYSYRLREISPDWSKWNYEDNVNYSNLKGGDYTFEFRVANKLFEWNETESVNFTIEKKITETLAFKLFLLLGILGLVYAPYWYRSRQMKREAAMAKEYQQQINELQMNALQMQMNPHFVFNSINSINYFIIQNDRDRASNYLAKFSRLIRQILENSKSKLISLEQELEAIQLYLEIEQVRFEGKFDFEIKIDEQVQLSSIQIPPLIIQPYIENAIWHGLMNKADPGQLLLHIRNAGDSVLCIIEDDGIGREAAGKLDTGKGMRKQSLGTTITKDRLQYIQEMYGIQTDVDIIDLKHMDGSAAGTRVVIKIPKLKLVTS